MNWRETILAYCERLDDRFWSEPFNAVSNAAFLISAVSAYAILRRRDGRDLPALALIGVTAIVGLGSFAFHTVATRGAMLLDVIPIAIFIYGYFFLALRRYFGLGAWAAAGVTSAFAAASYTVDASFTGLNGSIAYLPALAALISFSALQRSRDPETSKGLGLAATTFAASLVFRTMDRDVCGVFALGTHFVWHMLNALVLWLLLTTAIKRGSARRSGDSKPESERADGRM
ncbi:ceramidase domain-containing protein [Methylocystis iwaonis]|uniref:ceramidase domain-containing protein n=1 Tax=Methylocystis iwaonis TaxID=2885079 RepID=UPI002E7BF334|nr:ceramidase domain-containing protein [Methylocystis iwaonis]